MSRMPYPLQWPDGWKRARSRAIPKFVGQFARDRDSVIHQLRRRAARHIVITSDLPTRNDGLPYANATCSDPGIAVWWVEHGREQVMACDRWRTVSYNLRAIDMSLEALRGLDRWGASEMVERAFAGFAALPPGPPTKRPWREVLGVIDKPQGLMNDEYLAMVKHRHHRLIAEHHPDIGGDPARAAELNVALDEAEKELTP